MSSPGHPSIDARNWLPIALVLAMIPAAIVDVGVALVGHAGEPRPLVVRGLHVATILGYRAAIGLALGLVAAGFVRLRPAIAFGLVVVASLALASTIFVEDLANYTAPWKVLLTVVLGLVVPGLVVLGLMLGALARRPAALGPAARGIARGVFAAAGLAAVVANHALLPYNHPGSHLGLLVVAALAFAAAIGPRAPRVDARVGLGLAAAAMIALWSLTSRPAAAVAWQLVRDDSAGLYHFLGVTDPAIDEVDVDVDPGWLAAHAGDPRWFDDRRGAPAIPPSPALVDPSSVIVVLITIDALRSDLFVRPELVHFARLAEGSTVFTRAYATSSTTVPSVASIFTGRYLSGLRWRREPFRGKTLYFPIVDETPRLPELLPANVRTFNVPATERLRQRYGVVRGFAEEAETDTRGDLMAAEVLPLVDAWLAGIGDAPAFAYVHLMDAHAPYDSAGPGGDDLERHVRELVRVDDAIAEFIARLEERGLWSRTVLIIAADHGEVFGDHGQIQHSGSIYEPLVRVPLLVRVPGQPPREISAPASLIDLGPTILDLFQVPTPGEMLGQSLLPAVAGRDPGLDRPIVVESARLHRALVLRDRTKVIWRAREGLFERYDLGRDPAELVDLGVDDPADLGVDDPADPAADPAIAALRRFFRVHGRHDESGPPPHW